MTLYQRRENTVGTRTSKVLSTVMAYFCSGKEISMKGNGRMIRCMELVNIDSKMAKCTPRCF